MWIQVSSMINLNGNKLCVVDVETTGSNPEDYEVIQICLVPLEGPSICLHVKPTRPVQLEAMVIHGIDPNQCIYSREDCVDIICDWYYGLSLPLNRRLTLVAHNFIFEYGFLIKFFGVQLYDKLFHYLPRDTMQMALHKNDQAAYKNLTPPFERVSLHYLCNYFNIENQKPHDAYYDCLAEAELYKKLLEMAC